MIDSECFHPLVGMESFSMTSARSARGWSEMSQASPCTILTLCRKGGVDGTKKSGLAFSWLSPDEMVPRNEGLAGYLAELGRAWKALNRPVA